MIASKWTFSIWGPDRWAIAATRIATDGGWTSQSGARFAAYAVRHQVAARAAASRCAAWSGCP